MGVSGTQRGREGEGGDRTMELRSTEVTGGGSEVSTFCGLVADFLMVAKPSLPLGSAYMHNPLPP